MQGRFFILSIYAVILFMATGAYAWIEPAELMFECAEGKAIEWHDFPMGGELKRTPDQCRETIVREARNYADPLNDDTICLPKDLTDHGLYMALLKGYHDMPNAKQKTYLNVVQDVLWKQYTCSDEARFKREKRLLEKRKTGMEEFVAYERSLRVQGKPELCAPEKMTNREMIDHMLEKKKITSTVQVDQLNLQAALKETFPCP